MIKKLLSVFLFSCISAVYCNSQSFISTSELFKRQDNTNGTGQLILNQDPAIDTLISRYILANKNLSIEPGYVGMPGFRIQIYASNNRNAREESNKANADFIAKFPDITSQILFANPGYYKVRVGNYRSKTEATKEFLLISKEFPDAYLVPDYISFPDLNTK
jgi:hypothetical protein